MSMLMHSESRRLYSWWWDSHISPKNSKWLQENLTDMDVKVKAMIKLLEEEADSFARRAEMYYKKRPELLKLVEEFYRAYRALAERYDHATGALRHAHRTMAEAFPNHIPLALPDESLSNSSITEAGPQTPEKSTSRALFDPDDLQKDAFGVPTHFNSIHRNGSRTEENEALANRKGLKHFNEIFSPREGIARVKVPDGKVRKGINFLDDEGIARVKIPEPNVRKDPNFQKEEENAPRPKIHIDSPNHLAQEPKEKKNARYEIKHLQEEVSQLSIDNQKLKSQLVSESKYLDFSRTGVQNLKDVVTNLESEKETALLQNQLSRESIPSLEIELSKLKDDIKKLNEEMEMVVLKLSSAEKQCLALEKANQSLQFELEKSRGELEELRMSLQGSDQKRVQAEMSLQSSEKLYNQSQEKFMLMELEIQAHVDKLKEIEHSKEVLEEEVCQLKDMNYNLNEHNLSCALKIEQLQHEIISLKEINGKLEVEIEIHAESKKILQQELDTLKDDRNELGLKHQSLTEQMEASSIHIESLEILVKELKYDHAELKEICRKLEDEKLLLINKLKDMESVSERNAVLENSLSDANVELEELRKKIQVLEDSCEFLNAAVSTHVGEKAALASQIEALAENLEKLSEKNTLLENSLDDANTELEDLRSKFRNLEESCLSLSNANSDLIAEKNDLISQVESIQKILANLETTHAILEDKHSNLVKEKDVSDKEILKLEDSLSVMQIEHESLIQSNNTCLATLENQLHLMQEDRQCKTEELELAQQRCLSHMTENFILQRSLCDMTDFLIVEKQKYKSHIQSSEIQLAALENQIHLLEEERKVGDIKIEEEEQKSMHSMLENFILQKCLLEIKEDYLTLLQECQKHLKAARCSDELIKQLEGRNLAQNENIILLVEHISKLRDGIHLLLKPLNINKELMNIDGSEVIILQTIFDEIKNLLVSDSDSHDENQFLRMEISIYLNLLKEIGLEKVLLGQELGRINQQSLALQREYDQLLEPYEQLHHDMSASDCTNKALNAEMVSLTRKLEDLLEELYNLREEKNALEEESSLICAEAMTLEHLYLFFRGLNVESKQQLKFLGGDIFSLLAVKCDLDEEIKGSKASLRAVEDENRQLKDSLVLLEELKCRTIVSQFDLFTTSDFCKEVVLQAEAGENLLKEKSMELSVAKNMLQSKQEEVDEVCRKLKASNENVSDAKKMRIELEKNITVLLEDGACKDKEIANAYEENRALNEELDRFNVQVEVLRMREQRLSSEMQKEKEEIDRCEGEMMEFFNEVQVSVVNAAVLEDKMFELAVASEGLEISAMVQREKLNEEFALKNAHAVELKRKLDDLENENGRLRSNLNSFPPLIISLGNGIAYVEEQVCQLAKLHGKKDSPSSFYQEEKAHETSTTAGVLEMQNLIAKVEALQKLLTDTKSHLDQENLQSAANLESVRREVEELKLKVISSREEKHEPETSNGKHGVVIKDIQLDQVSNSIGVAKIQGAESDEQMLKLWETSERDHNNQLSTGHDIEAADEVKSKKHSSALVAEKEVSIGKLEISREIKESQEGWNRRVIKRLASDAKKLSALQAGAEEVKAKLDKSGEISTLRRNSIKLGTLKGKLKEAEEAISELADSNGKLKKKVQGYSTSSNGKEMGHEERRQVSEQVRSALDRIGMLELELQKIHYIFLKLEEEWENYNIGGGDRTPRVLLRDYLYGRKARQGKKRPSFCGLIRSRITEDDH